MNVRVKFKTPENTQSSVTGPDIPVAPEEEETEEEEGEDETEEEEEEKEYDWLIMEEED